MALTSGPSRLALVVSTMSLFLVTTAGPSLAHSELISASPASGEVLSTAPSEVVLTFGEEVLEQGSAIVVTATNGERYDVTSTLLVSGTEARVQLKPAATSGEFEVAYRIVSVDGHVGEDTYTYRLELTGDSASAPASEGSDPATTTGQDNASGSVVWVLGLGAIGLVLVAAMVAVFVRRRRD